MASAHHTTGGSVKAKPISPDKLARRLNVTTDVLAHALGLSSASVCSGAGAGKKDIQRRLQDMESIMDLAIPWAGSAFAAFAWYRSRPLPSFGGKTPQDLLCAGKGEAVQRYILRTREGGFA